MTPKITLPRERTPLSVNCGVKVQRGFAARFHWQKLNEMKPEDAVAKQKLIEVEAELIPRKVAPPPRARP